MQFKLSVEDFGIILNALHYYRQEPNGEAWELQQQYDEERINDLRTHCFPTN